MGVWNAIECWFLQRLVLGIRSSVGTLALPLRPLYSNISLLSFLLFLRDSHFNCPRMSVILPAFARFLILPGELHLGGGGPKPNCHNLGLGAPIFYKLPILPPGGKNISFSLRNPRVLLALVQTLLTCVFHLKSHVIVTPRYLMLSTFSRLVPSKVYEAWIFLIRFLVSCIILHLTGWNLIPHFLAQEPNRSISLWSFIVSFSSFICTYLYAVQLRDMGSLQTEVCRGLPNCVCFSNVENVLVLFFVYIFCSLWAVRVNNHLFESFTPPKLGGVRNVVSSINSIKPNLLFSIFAWSIPKGYVYTFSIGSTIHYMT